MSWATPLLIVAILLAFAAARAALARRYPPDDGDLIASVDALLPQTQCAQCGYPGCRPYAEAMVIGDAGIDLCPPGGPTVHQALAELLRDAAPGTRPELAQPLLAVIDESKCIGCALCLPPCPVDAIVGAQGLMHTIIESECTGCELCVPACPVDCIELVELDADEEPRAARTLGNHREASDAHHPCIGCGACNPVCPVDLRAEDIWAVHGRDDEATIAAGIDRCIECGLCDRACPSEIPLASSFAAAKRALSVERAARAERERLKIRYAAHSARLAARADGEEARRAERLANRSARRWQ